MDKRELKKLRKLYRIAQNEYNKGCSILMEAYLLIDPKCIAQKFYISKLDLKPFYKAETIQYWAKRGRLK